MTEQQRQEILARARVFFRDNIALNHKRNTEKLGNLREFNINPFTLPYITKFAFGNDTPESMAKALLYPRILGQSIATTFGTQLQHFCSNVLQGFASTTTGIDIEFIDEIDNRRKFCQIKSGPNTINHDDVNTIRNHFTAIRNLARTNRLENFNPDTDCIVGVFYGEPQDLSMHYKRINRDFHPVYVGKDFWHRLTGDENFYNELISAIAEVAIEIDGTETLNNVITQLAEQIRRQNQN